MVFDIGAHIGGRTQVFLDLGALVVAVEPQLDEADQIPQAAAVIRAAVTAKAGLVTLYRSPQSYMSTTRHDYIEQVQSHGALDYMEGELVPAITLDDLVDAYGPPSFVKIDVEGGEADVLAGLSRPVAALSVEIHDFAPEKLAACVAEFERVGMRAVGYSRRESFVWEDGLPSHLDMFGDVYAEAM
jgi:FkbM family methyltransferase